MSVWTEPRECELCGHTGHGIRISLVEWADAPPGMKWSHIPRCDDRSACQGRVQGKGEKWPVREGART